MDTTLELPCDVLLVSDGYHTFEELYKHRNLLWIHVLMANNERAFKTKANKEGEVWEGWFIAGMETELGQISYRLPMEYWDLLNVKEIESNSKFDGHTSWDTIHRLHTLLQVDKFKK